MTPLLEARDLEMRYPASNRAAVTGANFVLEAGSAIGIVGESGSGKTTLTRALVGALEPSSGEVMVSGRPWASVRRRDPLRWMVQMVFQDPYDSLNPFFSAREAVAETLRVRGKLSLGRSRQRSEEILSEVGLIGDLIDRRPAGLSGGQRQRVGIARALACDPGVLVADEPTSSLDVSVQAQILNLLSDLRDRRALALVLVSHDLAVVRHMTEQTIVMYAGRIVEQPTERLFAAPYHPYTRILLDSSPEYTGKTRSVVNDAAPFDACGCVYTPRCWRAQPDCFIQQPGLIPYAGRAVSCYHPLADDREPNTLHEIAERKGQWI